MAAAGSTRGVWVAAICLQCCVFHKSEGVLALATAIGSHVCMWTALPWLGLCAPPAPEQPGVELCAGSAASGHARRVRQRRENALAGRVTWSGGSCDSARRAAKLAGGSWHLASSFVRHQNQPAGHVEGG